MILHPRFKTLVEFADGELEMSKRAETAAHLARCTSCREKVSSLRSLSETASQAPEPEPPAGALDRILARREAGDRVILPVGPTRRPSTIGTGYRIGIRPTVAAAAAAVIAVVGLLLWVAPQGAVAGSGELRFSPARPTAGQEIRVEYRSGSFFPPADTLRLRARLRTASDAWYNRGAVQVTLTRLIPGGGDVFRGSFRLPSDVVYATFAVEDLEGSKVDANQTRLWELLVHGSDGRPLFEGLEQRIADHMGRNWEVARETAHWMTNAYPERVRSWSLQARFQSESLGEERYRELRPAHRERYLALHDSLSSERSLSAEQIHDMAGYYWHAGGNYDELDGDLLEYWSGRLKREYPDHPTVLFGLENETHRAYRDDPDGRVTAVEPLWRRLEALPPSHDRSTTIGAFINNTLNAAVRAEDPGWFARWIERYGRFDQATPAGIANRVEHVIGRDDLREEGIELLRRERARLETEFDAFRSLSVTRERQRALNDEIDAGLLYVMGRGFLAAGDTTAALDSLELATRKAWAPEVDRLLGEVRLATGDTLGALRHYAAVAADPGTPESFADSALSLIGTSDVLERWQVALEEARDRMARQVMAHADPQPIPGPVRLRGRNGAASTLEELAAGKPLAVIMFSRHCPWAVLALPEIERVTDLVGSRGGRVVLVTEDEPNAELDAILADEGVVDLVPLHDFRREATRAFSNFGTPHHFILDGDGTLIFKGEGSHEISRIPLEVEALLQAGDGAGREDEPGAR